MISPPPFVFPSIFVSVIISIPIINKQKEDQTTNHFLFNNHELSIHSIIVHSFFHSFYDFHSQDDGSFAFRWIGGRGEASDGYPAVDKLEL